MAVSADDPRPPYLQVIDDLQKSIASGDMKPGTRVPSGRDLATRYGVSLVTVQRALSSLQDAGVLVARQGHGTFVAADPPAVPEPSAEYVKISRQIGELRALVEETSRDLGRRLTALEESAGLAAGDSESRPRPD